MKFKGHTTIELKNVETGEIKKYEDDNMLTNAVEKMLNFASTHALGANPLDIYSSHWYNLLGGLVLFDTALTEDADNIYPPAGTKPVGYGQCQDTSSYTSISEWGVYNSQESDTSATDTKKMVWDFSTSHANGTIASIALTHRNTGLFGFGISSWQNTQRTCRGRINLGTIITQSKKGKQARNSSCYGVVGSNLSLNDGSYVDFCVDADNDEKYMFKVCADGLSIIKHKLYHEQMNMFRGATAFQSFEEETYSETFGGSYFYHFYNPDEKVLYFYTLGSTVEQWSNAAVSFTVHKFDMEAQTLTKGWKTFSMQATGSLFNSPVITNGGIYVIRYAENAWRVSKFDTVSGTVSNVASASSIDTSGAYGRKSWIQNGLIYIPSFLPFGGTTGYSYAIIIDTSDDTVRYTNNMYPTYYGESDRTRIGIIVPPIDNTQLVCGTMLNAGEDQQIVMNLQQSEDGAQNAGNVFAPISYLGTINNLSEPIVKTAQQTMKVTYTITVESEE